MPVVKYYESETQSQQQQEQQIMIEQLDDIPKRLESKNSLIWAKEKFMSSNMLENVSIDPGVVLMEKNEFGSPSVRSGGDYRSLKN